MSTIDGGHYQLTPSPVRAGRPDAYVSSTQSLLGNLDVGVDESLMRIGGMVKNLIGARQFIYV